MRRLIEEYAASTMPWYGTYHAMMDRCYRKTAANYDYYGGRGIRVCEEWHNVKAFGEWAESNGYKKGLSLDRIDPQMDYSPDNCRWVTAKAQANNRRNTTYITAFGKTMTLSEWSAETGISRSTLSSRLYRGWPTERIVMEGVRK